MLILMYCWQWQTQISTLLQALPDIYQLEEVSISPTDQKIVLGQETLGQRIKADSAEQSHLQLTYKKEQWWIRNIALYKKAYVYTDQGQRFFLKRRQVKMGDKLNLGVKGLEIIAIDKNSLTIFDYNIGKKRQIKRYNNTLIELDSTISKEPLYSFQYCDGSDDSFIKTLRKSLTQFNNTIESKPIYLGGIIDCPEQLAIQGVAEDSLRIIYARGTFFYASGKDQITTLIRKNNNQVLFASQTDHPINSKIYGQINKIIIGRTAYQVSINEEKALVFKPLNHIHLFFESPPQIKPFESLHLTWKKQSYQSISNLKNMIQPKSLGYTGLLLISLFILIYKIKKMPFSMKLILFFSGLGASLSILILFYRSTGDSISPQLLIYLALFQWILATLAIYIRARHLDFLQAILSLCFWLLITLLAGMGLEVLSQLALGANDTQWRIYFDKQTFSLSFIGFIIILFISVSFYPWWYSFIEQLIFNDQKFKFRLLSFFNKGFIYSLVPFLTLALLYITWLVIGSEAGVNGIQPVEIGKFFILIIVSIILTLIFLALSYGDALKRIGGMMIMGLPLMFLMVFMFIVTPLLKSDYSPILIILLSLLLLIIFVAVIFAMHLFYWKIKNAQYFGIFQFKNFKAPTVLFIFSIIAIGGLYFGYQTIISLPHNLPTWISHPEKQSTIAERILAWSDPLNYPDESYQLRRALTLISTASKQKQPNLINDKISSAVPAVQDDFILAFYFYRFGSNAGKKLFLIQITLIICLFIIALRCYRTRQGDYRDIAVRQFLTFTLVGFVFSQAIHWVIAWSNSFNFLPIMGQPMTWLSSGNSHLLGFVLPGLLITFMVLYSTRIRRI